MYPDYVEEAMPFVNDWRTNIELKISFPSSFGYKILTSGREQSGSYIYNRTCLSDVSFVITNILVTNDYGTLRFSAKPTLDKGFPVSMKDFESLAVKLFPLYHTFMSFNYTGPIHLLTLPGLNIQPLVFGKDMCIYDQGWLVTQTENYPYLLAQCFLHQYFISSLLPYLPPYRFIVDGLFGYYVIQGLGNKVDADSRLHEILLQVLRDENDVRSGVVLNQMGLVQKHHTKRIKNKGIQRN